MFKFYLKVKLKFMLKSSDLQSLKSNFEVKSYKKDEIIFPQGQMADGAYIVIKGLVNLKKEHKNASIVEHLGKIGPGDSFGAWYVLFESELRQVTAVALAAHRMKKGLSNPLTLKVLGGTLEVSFNYENETYSNVWLKGAAIQVYKGTIEC